VIILLQFLFDSGSKLDCVVLERFRTTWGLLRKRLATLYTLSLHIPHRSEWIKGNMAITRS